MTDLSAVYQRVIAARRPDSRTACPPPEALLAVVERGAPEDARLKTLNHALTCAACGEELELLRAFSTARGRTALRAPVLALAAALLLAVGVGFWRLTADNDNTALRAGSQPVGLVTPDGNIRQRPAKLVWRSVPNASRYTVEVRRDDGTLVVRGAVSDTTFALADSVRLETRTDFYWRVAARLTDGSEVVTPLRRFRIQTP